MMRCAEERCAPPGAQERTEEARQAAASTAPVGRKQGRAAPGRAAPPAGGGKGLG